MFRPKTRVLGNSREHGRPYFVAVMESEYARAPAPGRRPGADAANKLLASAGKRLAVIEQVGNDTTLNMTTPQRACHAKPKAQSGVP